jgi:hypothetical protein
MAIHVGIHVWRLLRRSRLLIRLIDVLGYD